MKALKDLALQLSQLSEEDKQTLVQVLKEGYDINVSFKQKKQKSTEEKDPNKNNNGTETGAKTNAGTDSGTGDNGGTGTTDPTQPPKGPGH